MKRAQLAFVLSIASCASAGPVAIERPCLHGGTSIAADEVVGELGSAAAHSEQVGPTIGLVARLVSAEDGSVLDATFNLDLGAITTVMHSERPECPEGPELFYEREVRAFDSEDGALAGTGLVSFRLVPDGLTSFSALGNFRTVESPWATTAAAVEGAPVDRLRGYFEILLRQPDPLESSCISIDEPTFESCIWSCDAEGTGCVTSDLGGER